MPHGSIHFNILPEYHYVHCFKSKAAAMRAAVTVAMRSTVVTSLFLDLGSC